jgi:RNA polymerase sigma-70 factor (ECF subfamily)
MADCKIVHIKFTICFLPYWQNYVLLTDSYKTDTSLIDRELIEECRNGNLQHFRKVIEISSPFAFSVAFRMIGDEDLAKDIAQEAMVTIWQKLKNIGSSDSFKSWLYRIVINKCYDHLRKKKKQFEFRADEQAWAIISNHTSSDQLSELELKETAQIINLLTCSLSPKQKAVFVLGDLEEMTHEEISSITGMNLRNVKANLYYARKKMNEMVKKYLD